MRLMLFLHFLGVFIVETEFDNEIRAKFKIFESRNVIIISLNVCVLYFSNAFELPKMFSLEAMLASSFYFF